MYEHMYAHRGINTCKHERTQTPKCGLTDLWFERKVILVGSARGKRGLTHFLIESLFLFGNEYMDTFRVVHRSIMKYS